MPNSDLQNKFWTCPDEIIVILKTNTSGHKGKKGIKGLQRAIDLISSPKVSYAQMKRLKNYFDNYKGDGTDTEYKLIGGDMMKNWVLSALNNSRDTIYNVKNSRMRAGEGNQFIDTHNKDNNKNPTGIGKPNKMHKELNNPNYILLGRSYNEEIIRIKQLIEHLSK